MPYSLPHAYNFCTAKYAFSPSTRFYSNENDNLAHKPLKYTQNAQMHARNADEIVKGKKPPFIMAVSMLFVNLSANPPARLTSPARTRSASLVLF